MIQPVWAALKWRVFPHSAAFLSYLSAGGALVGCTICWIILPIYSPAAVATGLKFSNALLKSGTLFALLMLTGISDGDAMLSFEGVSSQGPSWL